MIANSSLHELSLVPEGAYGVTPANPPFVKKSITGCTLALTRNKIQSNRITPSRQVTDVRLGNRTVAGDIMAELMYGEQDDMLQAVFCGTWTANVLKPGAVRRSFSILRHFTELTGAAMPFHLNLGCEFNTFTLTVEPEKIVTAQFAIMGRENAFAQTVPAGSVFTEANTNKPFDSFTGSCEVDGQEVSVITSLHLTVENGLSARNVVFDDRTREPKIGKTIVSGSLGLYFEDSSYLEAFRDGAKRSLSFTLVDPIGNQYTFALPSILGTGGQTDVQEENDITISYPFSAIYEEANETPDALTLTRTPFIP